MKRRTLIVAAGGALATAGCVSPTTAGDDSSTDGNADQTPSDGTPTETPSEGDGAGAPFEDIGCPSFAEEVDRTVCAHTESDSDVYPTVSTDVFSPTTGDDSVETMQIQVHNDSAHSFGFNPYAWALKRRTEGGWEHVAPDEYVEPWYTLDPTQTYTWALSVEPHPSPNGERRTDIVEDLDSGTYAFQMTGFLSDADSTPADDRSVRTHIECVALFNVSRS